MPVWRSWNSCRRRGRERVRERPQRARPSFSAKRIVPRATKNGRRRCGYTRLPVSPAGHSRPGRRPRPPPIPGILPAMPMMIVRSVALSSPMKSRPPMPSTESPSGTKRSLNGPPLAPDVPRCSMFRRSPTCRARPRCISRRGRRSGCNDRRRRARSGSARSTRRRSVPTGRPGAVVVRTAAHVEVAAHQDPGLLLMFPDSIRSGCASPISRPSGPRM